MAYEDYYVGFSGSHEEIVHAVDKGTPKPVKELGTTRAVALCGVFVAHHGHAITFEDAVRLRRYPKGRNLKGMPSVCDKCKTKAKEN